MSGNTPEQPTSIAAAARLTTVRKLRYPKASDIALPVPSCGLYGPAAIISSRSSSSIDESRNAPEPRLTWKAWLAIRTGKLPKSKF